MSPQVLVGVRYSCRITPCQQNVININHKNDIITVTPFDKNKVIYNTPMKTNSYNYLTELFKPNSRTLFETINYLSEFTHHLLLRRLLYKDLLF